jgi:hypothetical protein
MCQEDFRIKEVIYMALVSYIEFVKEKLHNLIEYKNYYLIDSEVIKLSQYLDKLIYIFQYRKSLLSE